MSQNQPLSKVSAGVSPSVIARVAAEFGTPVYLYDEQTVVEKCQNILAMPQAFGLEPSYAMKANSNRALLQLIAGQGFNIDASSFNEVKRAHAAGIALERIMLTTQEVPLRDERRELEELMLQGLRYNVCSPRQLELIADFAAINGIALSMRVHPGVGSGESATRNTGDKYSCFGVHLSQLEETLAFAARKGLVFDQIHVHIGSGGDPAAWQENIDRELGFVESYFPQVQRVNFGGGFREARMPDEIPADIQALGAYAKRRFEEFEARTGRKLVMDIEPGTYIVANAGFLITEVIDKKQTGPDGFEFIVLDGGMEVNTRPLLYGSRHPFYVVSKGGDLLSSEFDLSSFNPEKDARIVVGRCCESGDSQSLDAEGHIVPRVMADPELGDYVVVGGCGAYCASMSPFNYNSHAQAAEVLLRQDGRLQLIRRAQTLEQLTSNELPL
jgi:diaminopimelate decarboxylase